MRKRLRSMPPLAFMLALALLVPAFAQERSADVPMFRGNPARTGEMSGPAPAGQPRVIWRSGGFSGIHSTPALVADLLVFGGTDHIYALDANSGEPRWSFQIDGFVNSSPAVEGDVVYVGSHNGALYAIDIAGARRWEFTTGDRIYSSPVVSGGVVYIGSSDGLLYAVDAATGEPRWAVATGSEVISSPAIADGVVYVGNANGDVLAVDAFEGRTIWRFSTGTNVWSSPAVSNGVVYVAGTGAIYAVDSASGTERWSYDARYLVTSSVAVSNGIAYLDTGGARLYAFDAISGELRWSFNTGVESFEGAPPAIADNIVFFVNSGNLRLDAFDAATGEILWSIEDAWFSTSPVIANGVIYIYDGSRDNMLAIASEQSVSGTEPVGSILVSAFDCPVSTIREDYDLSAGCSSSGSGRQYTLSRRVGDQYTPVGSGVANVNGEVLFDNLPPGEYLLAEVGASWCYAEADSVNARGDLVVRQGYQVTVSTYHCIVDLPAPATPTPTALSIATATPPSLSSPSAPSAPSPTELPVATGGAGGPSPSVATLPAVIGEAPVSVPLSEDWPVYENPALGLSLRYPPGWQVVEDPNRLWVKLYPPSVDPAMPAPFIAFAFAPNDAYDSSASIPARATPPETIAVAGIIGRTYQDDAFAVPFQSHYIDLPYRGGTFYITTVMGPNENFVPVLEQILPTVVLRG